MLNIERCVMPYYNSNTQTFGVSFEDLKARYPNVSLPVDIKEYDGWVWYSTTPKPSREYSTVKEVKPVDGKQAWELVWSLTAQELENTLRKNLDDIVANAIHRHDRFRPEYQTREEEAKKYKAANYEGIPGKLLKGFADKAGMPYRNATDLVLTQSVNLRAIYDNLADQRMRKYEIKAADQHTRMWSVYQGIVADLNKIISLIS